MSTTALVPLSKDAVSVVTALENAKAWLANAVETTGPAQIAAAKAQIVTAATYAHELQLSKDIQMDAQEMVRRAEYALGKSIRKAQAEGTVTTKKDGPAIRDGILSPGVDKVSPKSFYGVNAHGGKAYEDGNRLAAVASEDFERVISEAKAEGNLTRANVVRKVKQQAGPTTRDQRADLIADLAAQGYSSRQMPARVGVTEESVRQIARDYDIEIPADKAIRKTRRLDHFRIAERTVQALEGLATGLELLDYEALEVDRTEAWHWATSLNDSLKALNRFRNQIKEMTQ